MSLNNGKTSSVRPETISLAVKPKLILSKYLQAQILYLHSVVGNIEWSGPLFYTIEQGSIEDMSELVVKAQMVFPKDVGTSGYTEYTMGAEMMDFYDLYPQSMGMKIGHIHTHHSMSTFFSGTDMDELFTNAPNHNYYVSLIVNHAGKYCAKVAISGDIDRKLEYKGNVGQKADLPLSKQPVMVTADFDIIFEQDDFMVSTIKELMKRRPVFTPSTYTTSSVGFKPKYDVEKVRGIAYGSKAVEESKEIDWEEWDQRIGKAKSHDDAPYGSGRIVYPRQAQITFEEESKGQKDVEVSSDDDLDNDIKDWLVKLITLNPKCDDELLSVIKTLDKRFTASQLEDYITSVTNSVMEYYQKYFAASDEKYADFGIYNLMYNASLILEDYTDYMFTQKVIEALDIMFDMELEVK